MPRIFSLSDNGSSISGCSSSSERRSATGRQLHPRIRVVELHERVLLLAQPIHRHALCGNRDVRRRSIPERIRRPKCAAARRAESQCAARAATRRSAWRRSRAAVRFRRSSGPWSRARSGSRPPRRLRGRIDDPPSRRSRSPNRPPIATIATIPATTHRDAPDAGAACEQRGRARHWPQRGARSESRESRRGPACTAAPAG